MVELLNRDPARLSPVLDASGREVSIESFRGKTVILNLWAPWCVPCLEEMPSLDRLAARLPDKDFAVVAVTKDPVGDRRPRPCSTGWGSKRLKLYLDPEGRLAPRSRRARLSDDPHPRRRRRAARLSGGRGGLGQRRHDRKTRQARRAVAEGRLRAK